MGLNANNVPTGGSGGIAKQDSIDAGTYPCRLVSVIDLGVQPQRPYQGQDKPPKHEIRLTYELLDEFCLDENGEEMEDKPRWLSEDIPFNSLSADLAKSTKRYFALDPKQEFGGDFTQLVTLPAMLTVTETEGKGKNAGRTFNNVGNLAAMRPKEASKAPELVNPTKVFVLDEPDLEVFRSLPEFLQDKIKGNLEFNGSALQKALSGETQEVKTEKTSEPAVQEEPEEDEEW